MKKVTVIGLGEMGSAIARTLLENNFEVTIWNRTSAKADKLSGQGAKLAENVLAAVEASPLIVTCVSDYRTTREILSGDGVSAALKGKTLVELTTGTPEQAREAESRARSFGAEYLDGAIAATPALLGQPETPIFFSGAAAVFKKHEAVLKTLGGIRFMGEAVGAAAAFDLGFLAFLWGSFLGFLNSASIFEAERLPVATLGEMIREISPIVGEMIRHESELIQKESFENPQSSLAICLESAEMILRQSLEAGTNTEIPRFTRDFFQKGVDAGYGREGIGALIKLMRKNN